MKYSFYCLVSILFLLGAGCTTVDQTTGTDFPSISDVSGPNEPGLDTTTIFGTIGSGRFAGTEMACEFAENAKVEDRITCNSGSVNLSVLTDDGTVIWLKGYVCNAKEIYIKEIDGFSVDYETSECTSGLVPGNGYSLEGILEQKEDQWYNGKQQDEFWFTVSSFEQEL
ncbi:MAG: hypothetical protein WC702_04825 [Patescibacteria group bacterium]